MSAENTTESTTDATVSAAPEATEVAAQAAASSRVTGEGGSSFAFGILGTMRRPNRWKVPRKFTAVNLLGMATLDLRKATLEAQQVKIRAFAVCGSINVIVPSDLDLEVTGHALFGTFAINRRSAQADVEAPAGSPSVGVGGFAVCGTVAVTRED